MMRDGGTVDPGVLERLAEALRHRGPDSDGLFTAGDVALVDTRLAIVDVANGQQPLFGPQGVVLVANGEIYNAPELRAELGPAAFGTLSDCEPVVHLFESLGPAYAAALRGMYGAALYDPNRRRLVLSRDQFGIKPLYYVQTQALFAFASEPQALFHAGLAKPELVAHKVGELLQLKHVTGAQTIFAGVRRVEPGETLTVEDARILERRRIEPFSSRPCDGAVRPRRSRHATLAAFEAVMTDSVAVHLRTDVPYGLFFSGGVDSTILLTLMNRLSATPTRALTLGYEGQVPGDESWTALDIAKAARAECRRVEMTARDFWTLAPRIVAGLDDPTTDAAILPTYMLARAARADGLKVVLCGEGADELFGGYSRYRRARLPWANWRRGGGPAKHRRGVFHGVDGLAPGFAGWSAELDALSWDLHRLSGTRMGALQALDCLERLPNSLLLKLDRCLMAHGVEGRTPFLDREVVAFALGLPDDLKAGLRHGKVLLRDWLARANPHSRPYARKQGFNPPVGGWMAERAATLGPAVAAQPGVAALAAPGVVRAVFERAREHHQPAWSLLFYALWHTRHVLGAACDGDVAEVLHDASSA